jgi:uncharacterized tellurite resistance protein B-like protein
MIDLDYRKLLLSAAFHAMTCDGELHQDELDSIRTLSEKSKIFAELDLNSELKRLSEELQQSTRESFRKFFSEVQSANLELSDQIQVVEVVIRVVYADGRIDENEIMYLNKIISILGILPELLEQRFGSIRNLLGLSEQQSYNTSAEVKEFEAPLIEDFEHITFKELKSDESDSE